MSTKSSPTGQSHQKTSPSIRTSSNEISSSIKTPLVEKSSNKASLAEKSSVKTSLAEKSSVKTSLADPSSKTCQKCREVVQPLRRLPCLHDFCGVCIKDRIDENNVFQCPVCAQVFCFRLKFYYYFDVIKYSTIAWSKYLNSHFEIWALVHYVIRS